MKRTKLEHASPSRMCNLYSQTRAVEAVRQLFAKQQLPLQFSDGIPNLRPTDIRITDPAPIVRTKDNTPGDYEMVVRRWSWPGLGGKPVFNFRSEGREFSSGRCLIITDGFYEFTASDDPKQKTKKRWLFTTPDDGLLVIAGLWRKHEEVGEAFTMLTTEPGPDIAPYHARQVVVLPRVNWKPWLDGGPAAELLLPAPVGTLIATAA